MNLEKASRILLLVCGLILVILGVPRLVLNTWLPLSNYLFYLCLVLFTVSMLLNYKTLLEFCTMRTTKYGLNMGTLIILGFLLFMGVNFIGNRYDKSIDITLGGLNSLSLQSVEVLRSLESDVHFTVYYQGDIHKNQNIGLKLLFKKYQRESDKVQVKFLDAHKDPSSSEYLNPEDKGRAVVVLKKEDRSERVKDPIDEDSLTSALFRLESQMNKVIYFSTGHGEKALSVSDRGMGMGGMGMGGMGMGGMSGGGMGNMDMGLSMSLLKETLEDKGFKVKSFNFLQSSEIPEDAAMFAIVGPKKDFLEHEVKMLQDFIEEKSGHVFFALDPSSEADFNPLLNKLGVSVEKNFILTTQPIAGGDALVVAAQNFDPSSEITNKLEENSIVLFYEATEVKKVDEFAQNTTTLVDSLPTMIPVSSLKTYQEEIQGKQVRSASLAILSEGVLDHKGHDHEADDHEADDHEADDYEADDHEADDHEADDHDKTKEDTPFKIIVYGDSDFLSDAYLNTVYNKDLALNSFAYLSGEDHLISIQPKIAESTKLILTSSYSAFIIIFPIVIPLLSLIISSVLWFRRRSA